jgi:hypothetical protein
MAGRSPEASGQRFKLGHYPGQGCQSRAFTGVRQQQMGGEGSDAKVRELTIIALVSLISLGLAWAYEADFFAMFFAAAAAIAGGRGSSTIAVTAFLFVQIWMTSCRSAGLATLRTV